MMYVGNISSTVTLSVKFYSKTVLFQLDKKWLLGLNDFSTVAHKPRLLCGWLFGASARHMETLPEGQVFNQTVELLDKFLGKSYNITRPTGMLR